MLIQPLSIIFKRNIQRFSDFIKGLIKLKNKEFQKFYNKYKKLENEFNKNSLDKNKIIKSLPELKNINRKVKRKDNDISTLGVIEEAFNKKVKSVPNYKNVNDDFKKIKKKMRAYEAYLSYLIQVKLEIIKKPVPGAKIVEKDLGIKSPLE